VTNVYALRDVHGKTIYVGMSKGVATRMSHHKHSQKWWHEVAEVVILSTHASRLDASKAERRAIGRLQPKYNKERVAPQSIPRLAVPEGPIPGIDAVSIREIGRRLGLGDCAARWLYENYRLKFPLPAYQLGGRYFWHWPHVVEWTREYDAITATLPPSERRYRHMDLFSRTICIA
jgi:predicted GIY-YIG superfamily endonuclease